jgi:uncharacterized Fe-S center protein
LGNISYLRPNYAKAVADVIKELGGKPFLTRLQYTLPGSRKNALEQPVLRVGERVYADDGGVPDPHRDGLKGTDDIKVPVAGGEYVKEAKESAARSWTRMSSSA